MNHARRTKPKPREARPLACLAFALCAGVSFAIIANAGGEETPRTLSVPVIGAPAPESSDESPEMYRRPSSDQPQPTLPDGRLPQYNLNSLWAAEKTQEQIEDGRLRFLLALPAEPILIETNITIDGEAFHKKREQRLQATLKAALNPKSEPPAADETEPDAIAPLTAEKPAQAATEGDEDAADAPTDEEPAVPSYQAASLHIEKLRRYIASIGREPSPEEVRWFFDNRLDGPTLLLLRDGFQAFRSDQTPIFHILDRNRDNVISGTEIDQAVESFGECDLNRNGIVTYLEINEAASDPRLRGGDLTSTNSLLYLLPTGRNAARIYADLLSRYDSEQKPVTSLPARFDANSDGQWDDADLAQLRSMPADITLNVSFSSDAANSSLSVSESSLQQLAAQQIDAQIVASSIVLYRPDCEVWLSAIQLQPGDQVSIGAVSDGYPMLPVLDPNDDGRFTIRELRGVTAAIRQFDVNGDGQILKDELRPTIRVSFGLGASVHESLAGVRSVHPPDRPAAVGPDWFVKMDFNKDHDLSRQEFPGTDEQFAKLDADKDQLISAEEALDYDRRNSPDKPDDNPPETPDEEN